MYQEVEPSRARCSRRIKPQKPHRDPRLRLRDRGSAAVRRALTLDTNHEPIPGDGVAQRLGTGLLHLMD